MDSWQITQGKGIYIAGREAGRTYQVTLPLFQGPLDLLLHLIEREQLDITKVALAQVTDQYLQYIASLQEVDVDLLSDFLVIAAKLVFIKSQVLLPKPPVDTAREEGEDVGDQLVRQLRAYRQFKQAMQVLETREALHLRSYVRVGTSKILESRLAPGEVTLEDLVTAARQVLSIRPPAPAVDQMVSPVMVTIGERIAWIRQLLECLPQVTFDTLMRMCTQRLEIIVTFMALLELIKQNFVDVQQDVPFGEIVVYRRPDAPSFTDERGALSQDASAVEAV
ncbi:MAG: segregation/condensation protein A [Anaerolineae bacterium]|nr:segregation/condensation protein A [Anaerolineae bacterium]MDW8070934.1 segregation/condensation protein A [Anaerolineae bacterium]